LETRAVLLSAPRTLALTAMTLVTPGPRDPVVRVGHSGISTGTERLFWSGEMPPFPGMGYPLVPGYASEGEVVEAGPDSGFRVGERIFVPGANCFGPLGNTPVFGLFGGASEMPVTYAARVTRIDPGMGAQGALLARLTVAAGAPPPTVWELNPARRAGATGYDVIDPETDARRDYRAVYDASGALDLLNMLIGRIARGGEVVLAGFYTKPLSFAFPPAFMKEARLRIAAEWTPDDLIATRSLIDAGALSLAGLITHQRRADAAPEA